MAEPHPTLFDSIPQKRRPGAPSGPKIDITGQTFGKITVVSFSHATTGKNRATFWNVYCSCDPERIYAINGRHLRTGATKSCGCSRHDPRPKRVKDISGRYYGFLYVLQFSHFNEYGDSMFLCQCDRCGDYCVSRGSYIKLGMTVSCGCYRKWRFAGLNKTHGGSKTREYRSWRAMKERCLNPKSDAYPEYGGRGIAILPEWINDFSAFREYMGPCPEGMSLDRKNHNGNYVPGNLRWADKSTQATNRRNVKLFAINGETKSLTAWCRQIGISLSAFMRRVRVGKTGNELLAPSKQKYRRGNLPVAR